MANIYRNIFIHGLTDLLGERSAYIKTRAGESLLVDHPRYDDCPECLDAPETQQDALRKATTFASFARRQDVYINKTRGQEVTAYTLAITDWFEAPAVLEIDVDAWTGRPEQTIRIKAKDNVQVTGVSVMIRDEKGKLLEAGEAVQENAGSHWWKYITRSSVTMKPFPSVEAIARDLPGNEDSFTIS